MIHPATQLGLVDSMVGYGVFATAPIPRGTIVWALDPLDRILTPAEIASLPAALSLDTERHLWLNRDGNYVLVWDLARFVNHSCRPNCVTTEFGCEIAVADIAPGDQITNDYADLGMLPGETLTCGCSAPNCRRIVSSGQVSAIRAALAESLAGAIATMGAVEQPLWPLLSAKAQRQLLVMQGGRPDKGNGWQIRDANAAPRLRRATRAG